MLIVDIVTFSRGHPPADHNPRGDRRRHPDHVRHPRRGHVPPQPQDDVFGGLRGRQVDLLDLWLRKGRRLQHRRNFDRHVILAFVQGC